MLKRALFLMACRLEQEVPERADELIKLYIRMAKSDMKSIDYPYGTENLEIGRL